MMHATAEGPRTDVPVPQRHNESAVKEEHMATASPDLVPERVAGNGPWQPITGSGNDVHGDRQTVRLRPSDHPCNNPYVVRDIRDLPWKFVDISSLTGG
jgi:hypothetical protein